MLEQSILLLGVTMLSSLAGAICGIGGGVIIKPVLDSLGFMTVSQIGFLSGCTVLAMSILSVSKNLKRKIEKVNIPLLTVLAIGAAAGMLLGILSSFLGIGGGPMNLIVLAYFFSMTTKETVFGSLYIIMFSQAASLLQSIGTGMLPEVRAEYLAVAALGGIAGGTVGSWISRRMEEQMVKKLFMIMLLIIIGINLYNLVRFGQQTDFGNVL